MYKIVWESKTTGETGEGKASFRTEKMAKRAAKILNKISKDKTHRAVKVQGGAE